MPINKEYKIIFVHIPKTGGTSVEQILEMSTLGSYFTPKPSIESYSLIPIDKFTPEEYRMCASKNMQHLTIQELKKILDPDIYQNYKKISIVRHPYDRLVSEFAFSQRTINRHHSFNSFVKKGLTCPDYLRNWLYDGHLETQTSYLLNEEGNFNSLDKIYRYEDFKQCLIEMNKLTGKNIYPHLYKTARKPYQEYYSPVLQELVYDFYKEDFVNFNFSPEL